MSHEMTRGDATAAYGADAVANVPVAIPGPAGTRDADVVDVWALLPAADAHNPAPDAEPTWSANE